MQIKSEIPESKKAQLWRLLICAEGSDGMLRSNARRYILPECQLCLVYMLGPIISENDPHFLLHRSLWPTNLEINLKLCLYEVVSGWSLTIVLIIDH